MTVIIIICVSVIIGLGAVIWLIKNDKDETEGTVQQLAPDFTGTAPSFDSTVTDTLSETEPLPLGEQIELDGRGKERKSLLSKLKIKNLIPKKKKEKPVSENQEIAAKKKSSPKSVISGLLAKLKMGKGKDTQEHEPLSLNLSEKPSLQAVLKSKEAPGNKPVDSGQDLNSESSIQKEGTASLTTNDPSSVSSENKLTNAERENIERQVESSFELKELQKKFDNLDKLFKEKSELLAKAEESLKNELSNQKDFNKVKDILEKELKDVKETNKEAQIELNNSKIEIENQQKRIEQLEEKSTSLEKEILKKEDDIERLNSQIADVSSKPDVEPENRDTKDGPPDQPEAPGIDKEKEDNPEAEAVPHNQETSNKVDNNSEDTSKQEPETSAPVDLDLTINTEEKTLEPEEDLKASDAATDIPLKDALDTPDAPDAASNTANEEGSGPNDTEPVNEPPGENTETVLDLTQKPETKMELTPENPFTLTNEPASEEKNPDNAGGKDSSFLSLQPDVVSGDAETEDLKPDKKSSQEEEAPEPKKEKQDEPEEKEKEKE